MKKIFNLIIVIILLAGCGSGGGSATVTPSDGIKPGDILIHTVFYNTPAEASSVVHAVEPGVFVSDYSTMVATNPIRMPAISQVDMVIINTTFFNNTPGRLLDLQFSIMIEHSARITRETWTCYKCYVHTDDSGSSCQGLWDIQGGFFYNTTNPTIPTCEGDPAFTPALCVDVFHPYINCAGGTYQVDYTDPGDGCTGGTGSGINIGPGESFTGKVGTGGSFDIRRDHLARAKLETLEGRIAVEEYYIFDVGP